MSHSASPAVSIVVPTYRRPALLRDCLDSLLAQTYDRSRFEVVVVADGPQPEAREIASEVAEAADLAVRYVEIDHGGPSAARNAGIAASSGSLLCFVDDDVQVPATWLERLVSGTTNGNGLTCFGGPIVDVLDVSLPRTCARCTVRTPRLDEGDLEHETEAVFSGNMATSRHAFERVGLFDESLPVQGGEEVEWQHRLRRAGGKVVYLPDPPVWHRKTAEDLRFRSLLRTHFRYGYGDAAYWVAVRDPGLGREAVRLALSLPLRAGHAARHGCWNGILGASQRIGFVVGAVVHPLLRRGRGLHVPRLQTVTTSRHDPS